MIYDEQMDKECIELCNAINSIKGCNTFESCCGHGKYPYRIWFTAVEVQHLVIPVMACNKNYGCVLGWEVKVSHCESPNRAIFLLEGPINAYEDADKIAKTIYEFFGQVGKEAHD